MTADDDRKHLLVIGPRNILFKTHTLITQTQNQSIFLSRFLLSPHSISPLSSPLMMFVNVLLCFRRKSDQFNFVYTLSQHHHPSADTFFFILCPMNLKIDRQVYVCVCVRVFACLFANKHECVHTISSAVRPLYIYTFFQSFCCCFGMFVSKTERRRLRR